MADFGDALDPTYPTLIANNGAAHQLGGVLHLGLTVDEESDGQPDAGATGDDNDGNDDEDGVLFTSALVAGQATTLDVTASAAGGLLNAWIDFNADGDWADAGEQIFTDQALASGVNPLSFQIPVGATLATTFARFRLSTVGGLSYTGLAADGEVEDYSITIANRAPTDISLSSDTVGENQWGGTTVGTFNTTDADQGDNHTYGLVATGCAGTDNASFTISGSDMLTAAIFDWETKNSYQICVQTDDGNGGAFQKAFSITVVNVITEEPLVETQATSAVGESTATLYGRVNPTGVRTDAWYQWGTDTGYGNTTTKRDVGSTGTVFVPEGISGLSASTTYHFRMFAQHEQGGTIAYGSGLTFTTAPAGSTCEKQWPVKIYGDTEYQTVQDGVDWAVDGNYVMLRGGYTHTGDVTTTGLTGTIVLEGGWNCDFGVRAAGVSVIDGIFTITDGTVIMDEVTIK